MKLTEIFNKQIKLHWEMARYAEGESTAIFKLPSSDDGSHIEVIFESEIVKNEGLLYDEMIVHIEFLYFDEKGKSTASLIHRNKEQFLIFSGVYQAIKEYLKEWDVDIIMFSAVDSKRVALYKKFIDKYAHKLGFKLSQVNDYDQNPNYIWSKFVLEKI